LIQPYLDAEIEVARGRGELNEKCRAHWFLLIETVSGRVQEACYSDF
jgi:hypothetical protein